MARQSSFTVSRQDLRRVLTTFGVSGKSIEQILGEMDKQHKHVNIISFTSMLEKGGLSRTSIANIFRRIGIDDVTISTVFNMVDEQKILAETGRIYNATLDLS